MREALALVAEEGLDKLWANHERLHKDLWTGLTELGLEPFVENPAERLITVNTIKVRSQVSLSRVSVSRLSVSSLSIESPSQVSKSSLSDV